MHSYTQTDITHTRAHARAHTHIHICDEIYSGLVLISLTFYVIDKNIIIAANNKL